MLNIIIYEDNKDFMEKAIKSVNTALANYKGDYKIHKFNCFNKVLQDIIDNNSIKKMFILDVEVGQTSGLEIASMVRENDWNSVIIISTAYDNYKNDVFYARLMVLDFICKSEGYGNRLVDSIKTAIKVSNKQKYLIFKYNYVLYRIPYNQICYIEKEPIIKRCIIHTIKNDFYIIDSINGILDRLDNTFLKTHQSCIVNLNNIKNVDLVNHVITFSNNSRTGLLTDKAKKELDNHVKCY